MKPETREVLEAVDDGLGCLDGCFLLTWRAAGWLLYILVFVLVLGLIVRCVANA